MCRIHSLSLPLSSCLGCILLLEGLPFLRSPLTRMFFLPFTYFAVVFCLFRWVLLCLSFCCLGFVHYYERSELLIDGDGKKVRQKRNAKKRASYAKKCAPILLTSDSELRPRRSDGVRLAYTDPSGERQRAPSTPRWGPSSLQRSFRRAITSSVHTCF